MKKKTLQERLKGVDLTLPNKIETKSDEQLFAIHNRQIFLHNKYSNEIIKKFRKIHGEKYDYSEVIYENSDSKVKIVCKIHGIFLKTPTHHLQGSGCLKCQRRKSKYTNEYNVEILLKKFKEIHGEKYDYSSFIESIKSTKQQLIKTKHPIICKKHGTFFQKLHQHLKGSDCPECARINAIIANTNPQKWKDIFIEKAKKIHGEKYDYSKVVYKNYITPVNIICPIHGDFFITANSHLHQKTKCPECPPENFSTKLEKRKIDTLEKFRKIHGEKYDYSKMVFKNDATKIEIICPIHGSFFQKPNSHKDGKGCLECGNKKKSLKQSAEKILEKYSLELKKDLLNGANIHEVSIKYKISKPTIRNIRKLLTTSA